ncbi:MAG TPA: phosphonate ABC transporter, permease protein PhnE [Spirochaetia bacterium]|nr:phosphonate ABC transporter, permease protein PhnE [Spirochaetia bacterium]
MEELLEMERRAPSDASTVSAEAAAGVRKPGSEPQRPIQSPDEFFRRRRLRFTLVFLLILALTALSTLITQFDFIASLESFPKALLWLAKNVVPTQKSLGLLPNILGKLLQTVQISIMSTVIAAVLAFSLALLGAVPTRPNVVVAGVVRLIASFFRNIPVIAWAMILIFSFGQSLLTGFLAIFIETFGFLVRSFIEVIDETSNSSVEALRATGASYLQLVFQAVIPSVKPMVLSWMLYMVETNIRSATLVGMLTGSGIGFAFDLYYKNFNYAGAALVILSIIVVVLLIETISNFIRRQIL